MLEGIPVCNTGKFCSIVSRKNRDLFCTYGATLQGFYVTTRDHVSLCLQSQQKFQSVLDRLDCKPGGVACNVSIYVNGIVQSIILTLP